MSKNLLRFGGAVSLLFVAFQLAIVKPISALLAPVSPDIRATISTLNVQMAFVLLVFAYLAIFRGRDLLTTRLGNITAIAISLFWFLRGMNQAVFYELSAADMPLIAVCLVIGLLHLIPVIREWRKVTGEAQPQVERIADKVDRSPERTGGMPWVRYAAVAWCVVFGGFHLYWALGGTAGFEGFSMPNNKILAVTRAPGYMGVTWAVVVLCFLAAIAALAPFQAWTRRIPRWLLLTPLWMACAMFLLRGFGNPIQSALILAGGMPFEPLTGPEAQSWLQWLKLDAMFFAPWFILGGIAFGLTAWSAPRRGDAMVGRKLVSVGQGQR